MYISFFTHQESKSSELEITRSSCEKILANIVSVSTRRPAIWIAMKLFLILSNQYPSPKQDSNLGLQPSTCMNIVDYLNNSDTTAVFKLLFYILVV